VSLVCGVPGGVVVRRTIRSILPFSGRGRILRFSKDDAAGSDLHAPESSSWPDQDELHRALGRVAANWSLIEIASGFVLMSLVGSRNETLARAVVAGQRVENVWETTEALLHAYGDTAELELASFQAWRRSANRWRRKRNEAIHSAWSLTSEFGGASAWDVMSQRAKRGARADLFPGGVAELQTLALDIADCEDRLTAIHAEILALMERRDGQGADPSLT
jgi:hypothetical protein